MRRLCLLVFVSVAAAASLTARTQEPKPDPQRPTFRTGAHHVRVDAYPVQDGRPVPGLGSADFEVLEDGKPQTLDSVEFIDHPAWTPLGERRDPNSQRDGFELARDPGYRVFVLYLDAFHVDVTGSHRLRQPVTELLSRMMGPQDLFGVLTPAQSPKDLLLGQLTRSIEEQLANDWTWGLAGRERDQPQPGEQELEFAFPNEARRLIALRRLDKVYADLEGLVARLGDLREERKNVIFFSDSLVSPASRFRDVASDPLGRGNPPPIGTSPEGKLTMGSRNAGDPDRLRMGAERSRLLSIDFDQRFRDLLVQARQANVAFYTVRPGGLDPNVSMLDEGFSNLQVLAEQTDGLAVGLTNDLRAGLGKVADDLSSHYVLGYYTNNTRWDGRIRKITVRLKPSGRPVRARREYRAPTEAEMTSIRESRSLAASASAALSPAQSALNALARISPSARFQAYGTRIGNDLVVVAEIAAAEMEAGRWKEGGDVQVSLNGKAGGATTVAGRIEPGARGTLLRVPIGDAPAPWQVLVRLKGSESTPESDTLSIAPATGAILGRPLAYRAASAAASAYKPLAAFQFRRTERIRVEWPVLLPPDAHSARLLDRSGKPLAIPMSTAVRDSSGTPMLTTELNLAPLAAGDYVIEVTVRAGETTEQQAVAVRVSMAR